jgi:uncharacterized protein (DUF433 family)
LPWTDRTKEVRRSLIVKDLDILGGTSVFLGTRVPFQALLVFITSADEQPAWPA